MWTRNPICCFPKLEAKYSSMPSRSLGMDSLLKASREPSLGGFTRTGGLGWSSSFSSICSFHCFSESAAMSIIFPAQEMAFILVGVTEASGRPVPIDAMDSTMMSSKPLDPDCNSVATLTPTAAGQLATTPPSTSSRIRFSICCLPFGKVTVRQ